MIVMAATDMLEREVAAVGDLPREELVARWLKVYGCPPPKGVKRSLLERSVTWHLQAKRQGGLAPEVRTALRRVAKNGAAQRKVPGAAALPVSASATDTGRPRAPAPPVGLSARLREGARLMREWNGRTYIVDVVEGGFLLDGECFRSLSAVARRITGARWSGPRFFGR